MTLWDIEPGSRYCNTCLEEMEAGEDDEDEGWDDDDEADDGGESGLSAAHRWVQRAQRLDSV